MKSAKTYTYEVTGSGQFPIDMLRYDTAYPAREVDSGLIEGTFFPRYRGMVTIHITGTKFPTVARWRSFGWTVDRVVRNA